MAKFVDDPAPALDDVRESFRAAGLEVEVSDGELTVIASSEGGNGKRELKEGE